MILETTRPSELRTDLGVCWAEFRRLPGTYLTGTFRCGSGERVHEVQGVEFGAPALSPK